jgi:hypothetical protein
MKLILPEHVFKKWVIMLLALREEVAYARITHGNAVHDLFETFVTHIVTAGKTEQQMTKATNDLFARLKAERKIWLWENSPQLHNLTPEFRFVWLFAKVREHLNNPKLHIFYDLYKRRLDPQHFEYTKDAELFD